MFALLILGNVCFTGASDILTFVVLVVIAMLYLIYLVNVTLLSNLCNMYVLWFMLFNFLLCYYGNTSRFTGGYSWQYHMVLCLSTLIMYEYLVYYQKCKNIFGNFLERVVLIATPLCAIYILAKEYDMIWNKIPSLIQGNGTYRLGSQSGWNSNSIALYFATLSIVTIYFIFEKTKNKKYNILSYVTQSIMILLTGSKKGLVLLILPLIALIFIRAKGTKLFKRLIWAVIILGIVLYIVFKVPFFYNVIGSRIESMLGTLGVISGNYGYSASTEERTGMIKKGFEMFPVHPIVGWGWWAFAILSGYGTYSHCNYVEILVSMGILGFMVFYGFYLYLIIKNIINFSTTISKINLMIMVCVLFIDSAAVTAYGDVITYLLLMIVEINGRNKRNKRKGYI